MGSHDGSLRVSSGETRKGAGYAWKIVENDFVRNTVANFHHQGGGCQSLPKSLDFVNRG